MRGLAAAWARADNELASLMLSHRDSWGLVEVLKAVTLLDAGRKIRRLEKNMKRLQMTGAKLNPKVLGKYKSNVDNLTALKPSVRNLFCSHCENIMFPVRVKFQKLHASFAILQHGSATGAICKHIRDWVRLFSTEELEFFALHMPRDPWQKLADVCHFNPAKVKTTVAFLCLAQSRNRIGLRQHNS